MKKATSNNKSKTINAMEINRYVSGVILGVVWIAVYCLLPKKIEKRKRNIIAMSLGLVLTLSILFVIEYFAESK